MWDKELFYLKGALRLQTLRFSSFLKALLQHIENEGA